MSDQTLVLIVESNPGALIVARNVLARGGHEVLTTGDILDGIHRAQEAQPHVVLLDGALTEPETLRALARVSETTLPVVLLVPKGLGPALLETLSLDELAPELVVVEVVEKPFLADRLLQAVDAALALKRPPASDDPAEMLSLVDVPGDDTTGKLVPFANFGFDGLEGEVVMSGRIGRVTVDQILQFAETIRGTTCCRLDREHGYAVEVYIRDHAVFYARQRNMPDIFGLGRFLVDEGFVPRPVLTDFIHQHGSSTALLGERLLMEGLIGRPELDLALRRQTEELVFEVLRWPRGRFQIFADPAVPEEGELAGLRFEMTPLLMEGLRRLDEWNRDGDPALSSTPPRRAEQSS